MKKLTLLLLLFSTSLTAGEIIPIWKNFVPATVQDMELMPGGEEFILTTHEATIEIRSTLDGSLIREYVDPNNLFVAGDIEFTPDSNRIILGISGLLQILDLETFERLGFFAFGPDTIARGFSNLVVDPVRPIVYTTINGKEKTSGNNNPIGKIQAYNYETMKPIKNLTEYGNNRYEVLAISGDGKNLATINNGVKSYLKVWDLETDELIINEPLFDEISQDENEAFDIYFSKKDRNVIYLSGLFSEKVHSNDKGGGLYKFEMDIKNRTLQSPNDIYGAWDLHFIDNEERVITTAPPGAIGVLNLISNDLEWYNRPPDDVFTTNVVYNKSGDFFIGSNSGVSISKFKYDRQTNVNYTYENEIIISPNPTNSSITIVKVCYEPIIDYSIYNVEGSLVSNSSTENNLNEFSIDFSEFSAGIYFLSFECDNQIKTYKIVKEG